MSERRKAGQGQGSITLRGDGRWMVRVTDPTTGKRRAAYFHDQSDAQRALRRMATRAEEGGLVLGNAATLRTWVEQWLPERAGRRRRESTVAAYEYRLRRYVLPEIGGIRLRELTPLDVDDLVHTMAGRGLSHSSVKGALVALSACLTDAVRGRLIPTNPAAGVEIPEEARPAAEVVPPTVDQVQLVLTAVQGTDVETLTVLLASTGARIGEALGAQWPDFDLDAARWTVGRTVTLTRTGSARLGHRTKTKATRQVALTPAAVAALRQQRARVAEARLLAGSAWDDHDLAFPTGLGTPQASHNVRSRFRKIAAPLGWPGSFHAFRHFVASVGLSTMTPTAVAKQLGHRRAALTTDVYGHLLADDSAQLAALVSRLVSTQEQAN